MVDAALSVRLMQADPDRFLAVAHMPRPVRDALTALFALDTTLGGIVASTQDVGLGQIRLAWWREALQHLDRAPPPGEPVLQALHREVLTRGITGEMLSTMEEGWLALLLAPSLADPTALADHARLRGARLFDYAATLLGRDGAEARQPGAGWALGDLARRLSDAEARRMARTLRDERLRGWRIPANAGAARPLFALAAMMRDDNEGQRAGPGRQLRFLLYRFIRR